MANEAALNRVRRERCQRSFFKFLEHWKCINRETGDVISLKSDDLWEGQRLFADKMLNFSWIVALKAGKLGFTELECAWDAWKLLGKQPNARVHLFSRDQLASKELLGFVKFGIEHLPNWLRPKPETGEAGGDTSQQVRYRMGTEDVRTIVSYACGPNISIDQNCYHAHVDELAHMQFGDSVWNAVRTTVAPVGTCHVLSRGAGDDNKMTELYNTAASDDGSELEPVFAPWTARPGRSQEWYEQQTLNLTPLQLNYFAPETPEEALAGDVINTFCPIALFDACYDPELPPFSPEIDGMDGARTPVIISADAAVTGDCFAITVLTRHPKRPEDVAALRAAMVWKPPRHGEIDFTGPEGFMRYLVQGGCNYGHPNYEPFSREDCISCQNGDFTNGFNVIYIVYDMYQLSDMMQRLNKDLGVWVSAFDQTKSRLIADKFLRDIIVQRRLAHPYDHRNPPAPDDPRAAFVTLGDVREHIENAAAKVPPNEDNKLRIIKKAPHKKVDLTVALSMGAYECLRLHL